MVVNITMGDNEESGLDDKVVKRTQDTLGKLIKAPPLTEKLLSRPPFRFLHDVLTAVMKATGFMKGLHADSDLKSDNVKEKDHKVAFLQKTIDFVAFVTGRSIATNPLKVVAGKEADKTNEFLQAVAEAATKKVDNDVMVKRFLNGEKRDSSVNREAKDSSAPSSKHPQNKTSKAPAQPHKEKPKERPKENGLKEERKTKDDRRAKESSPERPADTTNLKNRPREAGRERGNTGTTRKPIEHAEESDGDVPAGADHSTDHSNRRLARPPSARGRQPSGVASNRTAPDQHHEPVTISKPNKLATPSSSKVVIQKAPQDNDSDEEDEFVVREAGPGALNMDAPDSTASALTGEGDDQHGALVQKIIDTTKALDAKTGAKTKKMSAADEAALRRQREAVTKEMEKLCAAVQASARLAAPLARLSELVQEDLDAMNVELTMWRAEHRKAVAQIAQAANPASQKHGGRQTEVAAASAANEALRGQLRELDSQVTEMADAVAAVRGNCMRNEQRIGHMLSGSTGTGK